MTPLGKAALALAARGMRVFPLPPRKKEPPLFDGLQKYASTDPQKVQNWWRSADNNIGIATGSDSGVWVLDVDGDEGEAALRKLEAALPPTIEVITGDGRHVYFRWPAGFDIRNSHCRDDLPGLDWRGDGGYAVAPRACIRAVAAMPGVSTALASSPTCRIGLSSWSQRAAATKASRKRRCRRKRGARFSPSVTTVAGAARHRPAGRLSAPTLCRSRHRP